MTVRPLDLSASRDVAIVGAAVRVQGAATPRAFSDQLRRGEVLCRPLPEERARWLSAAGLDLPSRIRVGGFLDDPDAFDPEFFGLNEQEARWIDPQQRLFLDLCWEALERAGYRPDALPDRRCGVFLGIASTDFAQLTCRAGADIGMARISGGLNSFAASRIAYHLDLTGPAVSFDAACASSLYAVHLAVQSLRAGETRVSIAGGVNLIFISEPTETFDRAGLLSLDGRCRAYDDAAAGYFRGEGAVALLLKRLPDALADGDDILATIKGSGVAQDGHRRAGLVAPSVIAQKEAATAALADAGVPADSIGLVEAQGSATPLGDAMEIKALAEVYAGVPARCALGSVKTQIGHLEAAAGAAGLLCAALALREAELPPNGRVDAPSRLVELEETPFFLADRPRPFPKRDGTRRAAVHAHGLGGLNVHLILEEAPSRPAAIAVEEQPDLLLLSAHSSEALRAEVDALLSMLERDTAIGLADLCASIARSRKPRAVRLAIVARSLEQLADRLNLFALGGARPTLGASGIFASEAQDPVALTSALSALAGADRALVKDVTHGRWAERNLHPRLDQGAPLPSPVDRLQILKLLGRAFVAGAEIDRAKLGLSGGRVEVAPAARRPRKLFPLAGALRAAPAPEARPQLTLEPRVELRPEPEIEHPSEPRVEPPASAADPIESFLWSCLDRVSMRAIAPRDPERAFLDLGVDSVTLMRFAALIEDASGARLPTAALYETPTIRALAARLVATLPPGIDLGSRLEQIRDADAPASVVTNAPFALTPLQEAYLGAARMPGGLGGRSCQVIAELALNGQPDLDRLERALERLLLRHPMLRAVFGEDGTQRVSDAPIRLAKEVVRESERALQDQRLGAIREQLLASGADLDRGPMIRAVAVQLPSELRLLITIDLLVADLESVRIAIDDWRSLYDHPEVELPPLGLVFSDYLRLLEARGRSERWARDREYWMGRVDSFPGPPHLPLLADSASREPRSGAARFAALSYRLDPDAWRRLTARANGAGLTPAALLAAAFGETLARFSDGTDFCLNLPVFDRRPVHPDVDRLVGPFSTNLLIGMSGATGDVFARARAFDQELRVGLEHRTFGGVELARALAQRRRSLAPIAPVVFTAPLYGRDFEPRWRVIDVRSQTPQVWLDGQVVESGGGLLIRWDYVESLFDPETIATMFRDFVGTVRTLSESGVPSLDGPAVALRRAAAEQSAARSGTLDGLLAEQARRAPHHRAVVDRDRAISYLELDRLANRVAHGLLEAGVVANDRVAILCRRGIEQIAAVVGVLRAGAAYVPVEPSQPAARIAQIIEGAASSAVVVDSSNLDRAPAGSRALPLTGLLAHPDASPPSGGASSEDLAYVIFTSGSTGAPKGVMIAHAAALNTLYDINLRLDLGPFDRVLAFSSLGFDLSVWDLFGTFAAGATVVVLPDDDLKEPGRWLKHVEDQGVTVFSSVPSAMKMLLDFFEGRARPTAPSLRAVMLSGDWIPLDLPARIKRFFEGAEVISLGGATEGSIWSCLYRVGEVDPGWKSVPYGRAISGQTFHVLDEALKPVPPGEVGELFIGGRGVAIGYFGDPARTAERFVAGPPGLGRLYRTGDLGRWREDGEMEILGRKDFQLKIRGFRVELAEIETALRSFPAVGDCVVTARGADRSDKELVAHYVPRDAVDADALRRHLRERLPEYMVPQHFIALERLPLNANGKIDRTVLT